MELRILDDRDNKIIGRREISFAIDGEEKTPSSEEARRELCKKLNLDPDKTIVTSIIQKFGIRRAECVAHSYNDRAVLERYEQKHVLERMKKRAVKGKAAQSDVAADAPPAKEAGQDKESKKEKEGHEAKPQPQPHAEESAASQ